MITALHAHGHGVPILSSYTFCTLRGKIAENFGPWMFWYDCHFRIIIFDIIYAYWCQLSHINMRKCIYLFLLVPTLMYRSATGDKSDPTNVLALARASTAMDTTTSTDSSAATPEKELKSYMQILIPTSSLSEKELVPKGLFIVYYKAKQSYSKQKKQTYQFQETIIYYACPSNEFTRDEASWYNIGYYHFTLSYRSIWWDTSC